MEKLVRRRNAAAMVVRSIAAHKIKIGRGEDGESHPAIGHAAGGLIEQLRRGAGGLRHMSDGDPPAIFITLGQLADVEEVHVLRVGAEVEMHVDVDVELASNL